MTSESRRILELGEIIKTVTPPKKIQTSEFLEKGDYPIVDQSPPNVAGWTNDATALVHPPKDGLIVFGDHTCVLKFERNSFAQGADGIKIIEVKKDINPHYVYAHLKAFPLLNDGYKRHFSELKRLKILIPDSNIQDYISEIHRLIDSKIASNIVLSKTLEDIAQTIFKSWFIDFDPVKAKMAGQKQAGLDAASAELFPDSMEDSELGEIPAGWQVASLGSIASICQGKYLKPSDMSPTRSVEFPNPVEGATKIIGYSTKSTFNFNFSSVSCRGSCGFVRWICSPAWISNNLMAIHGKGEEEINHYLHFLLKSINFESVTTGSVQGQITITNLSSLRVTHNIKLAKRFSEMVEPIHEEISTLERQSAALAEIRDTLMLRLISGELQIPEEMLAS